MPLARAALETRLRADAPLVLDGATGTELERRGVATLLPLWSARALDSDPELVRRIHADYVACGVDAVTANTFRTQRRTLARAGIGDRAEELTRRAVALARSAAGDRAWVFGSSPTLEDCYHPERVPDAASLAREHAEHARHLALAGVDAILVETMNTQRESSAALRAARDAGVPALASFVCWDGARLLSGPFGIYPNLGAPEDELGVRRSEDVSPEHFAELAAGWAARGARVLGGCCGTTPAHLGALVARLR
jgi:S-methylmethionine-dependent homocysteine/selenocysteine methylase